MPPRARRPAGSLAEVPYRELAEALRTQSLRRVARHYGVARNTVRYWRAQLGIPGQPPPVPRGPALEPQLLQILAAHPDGVPTTDLARRCTDTYLVVYRALRRLEDRGQVVHTVEPIPGRSTRHARWYATGVASREWPVSSDEWLEGREPSPLTPDHGSGFCPRANP